jgi:hypothetical protein
MTDPMRLSDDQVRRLMGHEPTPHGWVPIEVAEEHERTGLSAKQWRRFSFVTTRGWVALPDRTARLFGLAACGGKMLNVDGTFARIRHADEAACVLVYPFARNRVIALLGRNDPDSLRPWRRAVSGWELVGMAHGQCRGPDLRPATALFFEPKATCPSCGTATRWQVEPPLDGGGSATKRRAVVPGSGDASRDGRGDAAVALGFFGSSGSTTSAPHELIDERRTT